MYGLFGLGILWFAFHAICWLLVAWFLLWIIRSIFGHRHHGRAYRHWMNMDRSHSIIRERYAKGEITKEEFEKMTQDLG